MYWSSYCTSFLKLGSLFVILHIIHKVGTHYPRQLVVTSFDQREDPDYQYVLLKLYILNPFCSIEWVMRLKKSVSYQFLGDWYRLIAAFIIEHRFLFRYPFILKSFLQIITAFLNKLSSVRQIFFESSLSIFFDPVTKCNQINKSNA